PQETILFDGARLKRTIDVELAEDARLILAEAVVFGRTGMGEAAGRGFIAAPRGGGGAGGVVDERAARRGRAAAASGRAAGAWPKGAAAIATVLAVPGEEMAVAAVRALKSVVRGEVGISAWNGLAVARLCAADGAALRHDLLAVLNVLRGSLPRLWIN